MKTLIKNCSSTDKAIEFEVPSARSTARFPSALPIGWVSSHGNVGPRARSLPWLTEGQQPVLAFLGRSAGRLSSQTCRSSPSALPSACLRAKFYSARLSTQLVTFDLMHFTEWDKSQQSHKNISHSNLVTGARVSSTASAASRFTNC